MNDLVVSERQKHNGMSWSKGSSVALATITFLKRNKDSITMPTGHGIALTPYKGA